MNSLGGPTDTVLESAIYQGVVSHRRHAPAEHGFSYPMLMLLLKTDEIPRICNRFWQLGTAPWSWARFRRADYIGHDDLDLQAAAKREMARLLGDADADLPGDVFLLCHLRYLGFYFSPLNLYFLRQQGEFRYMLAEVSNTPWNERHYYLVDLLETRPQQKSFHVSPFNPMNQTYHWQVTAPDVDRRECRVRLSSTDNENGRRVFEATLSLHRHELNQSNLTGVLMKTPAQTISVVVGIYWQALRLFVKRVPFYGHPRKKTAATRKSTV